MQLFSSGEDLYNLCAPRLCVMCKIGTIKTLIRTVMFFYNSVHLFILKFQVDNCLADFNYSGHEIDAIASHPTFVLKFL
jgi:hypothetical protein